VSGVFKELGKGHVGARCLGGGGEGGGTAKGRKKKPLLLRKGESAERGEGVREKRSGSALRTHMREVGFVTKETAENGETRRGRDIRPKPFIRQWVSM